MSSITLDALASVIVDSDEYFNECRTLHMLQVGLFSLADNLKRRELAFEQHTGGRVKLHMFGLDIDGTKKDLDLITCFFHWFGVSVCNYARLVGFIRGLCNGDFSRTDLGDSTRFGAVKSSIDGYVNGLSELSDVLLWRNKVGAHFAITAPHKLDNISTLEMSTMFPVTFSDGRYRVGELILTRSSTAGTFKSQIPHWSMTSVFESLVPRFWPTVNVAGRAGQEQRTSVTPTDLPLSNSERSDSASRSP